MNGRFQQGQGPEEPEGSSPQHYYYNNSSILTNVIPWSPWSPAGQLQQQQPEQQLHAPLLSTPTQSRSLDFMPSMSLSHEFDHEQGQDEERASSSCFARWCSYFWCCRPARSFTRRRQRQDEMEIMNEEEEGESSSVGCCSKFLLVLLSAIVFGALIHISGKENHQKWNMATGESRQVSTAPFGLTDTVQVVSHTPPYDSSNDVDVNHTLSVTRGMAVYAMGNEQCPLLTGPPIVLDSQQQELVLFQHAWEYQFFYLNEGSTMEVKVRQLEGATNILVLRGSKVLARIQDTKKHNQQMKMQYSDMNLEFEAEQVMLERFSWTEQKEPVDFSFTSPASDVYVLLYDNAATSEPATLQVKYHMVLTTFDLEGLVPWCSHTSPPMQTQETSFTCPPLEARKAGCIIVEAISHSTDSNNSTNSTNGRHHNDEYFVLGQEVVQVTLLMTRLWTNIGIMSIVPSLLIALYLRFQRRKQQRGQRRRYYRRLRQQRRQEEHQQAMNHRVDANRNSTPATGSSAQQPSGPVFHFLTDDHEEDREEGDSGAVATVPAENVILLNSKETRQEENRGEEAS